MEEKSTVERSLLEQVLDETLDRIEKKDVFDEVTLLKLKQLIVDGDIEKTSKLVQALKATEAIKQSPGGVA